MSFYQQFSIILQVLVHCVKQFTIFFPLNTFVEFPLLHHHQPPKFSSASKFTYLFCRIIWTTTTLLGWIRSHRIHSYRKERRTNGKSWTASPTTELLLSIEKEAADAGKCARGMEIEQKLKRWTILMHTHTLILRIGVDQLNF